MKCTFPVATLALLLAPLAAFSQSNPDAITEGALRTVSPDGQVVALPLKHTAVTAEISGFVSRVKVVQTFQNPFEERIEAVYVFPLPDKSGVDGMTIRIGERVIQGQIKQREEARQIYEAAKHQGRTAALLDQERPNIFTQSVANILPGEQIDVTLTYVSPLEYDAGRYTFNFPMVVGPRYIPSGAGTKGVPDAARISPPLLKEGQRSGHDISVAVKLDAGVTLKSLESPSHDVEIIRSGMRQAEIRLKSTDSIPNKDFILRYDVAGEQMQAGILTHRDERGGFFTLMLQPQADFRSSELTAKEMFFVVDQSCSQSGLPMAKQKGIIHEALDRMNPNDTFNIVTFNSGVNFFSSRSLPNRPEHVRSAKRFVDGIQANGGTEMLRGVIEALNAPRDRERLRMILFLSDGYVGNDSEIIAAVEKHIGNARMFTYGVGSSVNHYLLDRMAEVGRGYYQYSRYDEATEKSVKLFYDRIAKPYLVDIELDFGDLGVTEVYPKKIRDLFSAQPIILTGRYASGGSGRFTLRGRIAGKPHVEHIEVQLPKTAQPENEALASMFGRARIEHLSAQQYGGEKPELVKGITDTALSFRLMSKYTSFVAVDESRRAGEGAPMQVTQPVPIPEGTQHQSFGTTAGPGSGLQGKAGGGKLHAPPPPVRLRAPSTPAPAEAYTLGSEDVDDSAGRGMTGVAKREARRPMAEPKPQTAEPAPQVAFTLHDLVIRGALSRNEVKLRIERVLRVVQQRLGSQSGSGEISLKLVFNADGTVKQLQVIHDGVRISRITNALKKELQAMSIPKAGGETVVTLRLSAR